MSKLTDWIEKRREIAKFGSQGMWRAFKWGDGSQEKTATANVACVPDETTVVADTWELDANAIADAHNNLDTALKIIEIQNRVLANAIEMGCSCGHDDNSRDALAAVDALVGGEETPHGASSVFRVKFPRLA